MSACLAGPRSTCAGSSDLTVNALFRRFGTAFAATTSLSLQQRRVLRDLQLCRTPQLGGHLERCDSCGHCHLLLHSCRNRHCPTCQSLLQKAWLEARCERILPVPHFHVVFTLPACLRPLVRAHGSHLYKLLFETTSTTLLTFGKDPRHLGAQLGITAVLHTWTRDLQFHPHLHCIVTAGGLNADGSRWVPGSPRFLFPVKALSALFRGKFLDGVQQLFHQGHLPSLGALELSLLLASARAQPWVVYAKRPFGGTKALFSYLGRYTHRTGISNQRLLSVSDDAILFRTRGKQTCTLAPFEFLRRFLLHVLPPRFVKVRHFGLYASGNVNHRLRKALLLLPTQRRALAPDTKLLAPTAGTAPPLATSDSSNKEPLLPRCPVCLRGSMVPSASLEQVARVLCELFAALAALRKDTS